MTRTVLTAERRDVVSYEDGADMPRQLSPRPYLQATTLAGIPVTQLLAPDHAHHFGVSLALPDVNSVSFWGGRTFVRGTGSTMLENHGTQRVVKRESTADRVRERLDWVAPGGAALLTEERELRIRDAADGWALGWRSVLAPVAGDVTFGSPQTNGRPGAFYGGIFWRTPFAAADILTADGAGIDNAHGSASPWLAVISDSATLVALAPPGFPWFVRDEGYVGFCPAVAVGERRRLVSGDQLLLELRVAVLDGRADEAWIDEAVSSLASVDAVEQP